MYHEPVLKEEVLSHLNITSNATVVDCNLGGGGHAQDILKSNGPNGILIGIDLDSDAIAHASEELASFGERVRIVQDNFSEIRSIVDNADLKDVDAILFDLGLSKFQLEESERGFSFKEDKPLEMSFSHDEPKKAADILNSYADTELLKIFREYGELKNASRLAHEIVLSRQEQEFKTVGQLVAVAEKARIHKMQKNQNKYLSQVFQALRIEVNNELEHLRKALEGSMVVLKKGGRIGVISYHSLEDRIVKHFFKDQSLECICPPELPICACEKEAQLTIVTKKPILPTEEEVSKNNKSRSAKLRVAEKI